MTTAPAAASLRFLFRHFPPEIPVSQSLSPGEQAEARQLYADFWREFPGVKNPSDINSREKATYLMMIGWHKLALMQRARKQGYAFTRPDETDD